VPTIVRRKSVGAGAAEACAATPQATATRTRGPV
jgi:hypothetical protein